MITGKLFTAIAVLATGLQAAEVLWTFFEANAHTRALFGALCAVGALFGAVAVGDPRLTFEVTGTILVALARASDRLGLCVISFGDSALFSDGDGVVLDGFVGVEEEWFVVVRGALGESEWEAHTESEHKCLPVPRKEFVHSPAFPMAKLMEPVGMCSAT